jgi:acetyl-CoA C-acetyltransferase
MEEVVITSAMRTPVGGFQGDLNSFSASELGGTAIKGALEQAGVDCVDEVIMGNVLGAGQGQAPARQASFMAGLNENIPATTLNKMCGSGMKAAMIGFDQIKLGQKKI